MPTFTLEPYLGPVPLRFGMTPREVEDVLGKPIATSSHELGIVAERRPNLAIGFRGEAHRLTEAIFTPGAVLLLEDQNLFGDIDPTAYVRRFDSELYEWVGFIISLKLGIRISGFHDDDEPQTAIGMVAKGYEDEYVGGFHPFPGNHAQRRRLTARRERAVDETGPVGETCNVAPESGFHRPHRG